jgi:hypothetical protein
MYHRQCRRNTLQCIIAGAVESTLQGIIAGAVEVTLQCIIAGAVEVLCNVSSPVP